MRNIPVREVYLPFSFAAQPLAQRRSAMTVSSPSRPPQSLPALFGNLTLSVLRVA